MKEAPDRGRIKAGEGTLIGNAGEYYVVAELLKRGVVAALAPRNAPGFDILATLDGQTVKIRVKTKSQAYGIWQWSAKKDGTIFRYLSKTSDFTVLVNLTRKTKDLEFFIRLWCGVPPCWHAAGPPACSHSRRRRR